MGSEALRKHTEEGVGCWYSQGLWGVWVLWGTLELVRSGSNWGVKS